MIQYDRIISEVPAGPQQRPDGFHAGRLTPTLPLIIAQTKEFWQTPNGTTTRRLQGLICTPGTAPAGQHQQAVGTGALFLASLGYPLQILGHQEMRAVARDDMAVVGFTHYGCASKSDCAWLRRRTWHVWKYTSTVSFFSGITHVVWFLPELTGACMVPPCSIHREIYRTGPFTPCGCLQGFRECHVGPAGCRVAA